MVGTLRTLRGFTLLEILVVISVIALLLAVVPPLVKRSTSSELKSAVRDLVIGLRWARSEAVGERHSVALWVDTAERNYFVETRPNRRPLPDSSKVLVTTVQSETDGSMAAIRFYPDGSSTGGSIDLSVNGEGYRIKVDWLTGGVSLDGDPGL